MTSQALHLTIRAVRKDGYWIALPVGVTGSPGGVSGDTLSELFEEVEAFKHFILDAPRETEVAVDYVYDVPGVPAGVLDSYRDLRARRDEMAAKLGETAAAAVAALRGAGVSVRDAAALLDLSRSRVDQLSV
jgi:hypothetical protein